MIRLAQTGTVPIGMLVFVGVACGGDVTGLPPISVVAGGTGGTGSGGFAHDNEPDASTGASGGGGAGGASGAGPGLPTDGEPDGGGLDRCQSCRQDGSDLELARWGTISSGVSPDQFVTAAIKRDPSGALVLSGDFYTGCDGCGGPSSDYTVAIPLTVLTPENEEKLAELTSGLALQQCIPLNLPFCHPIYSRVTIGGCSYWYMKNCEGDRANEARLHAVMAYIDGLGLAALGRDEAGK